MKAYACVGSHGGLFVCSASENPELRGRYEIFQTKQDAERMAIGPDNVREVTITVHRKKTVHAD